MKETEKDLGNRNHQKTLKPSKCLKKEGEAQVSDAAEK